MAVGFTSTVDPLQTLGIGGNYAVMRITVVLDKAFGAAEQPNVGDAFWLIGSSANQALADRLRNEGWVEPNSAIFDGDRYESRAAAAVATFYNVLDHHPSWTEIEFIGVPLSPDLAAELNDPDVGPLLSTADGFVVSRKLGS